jgi:hypothetical protein
VSSPLRLDHVVIVVGNRSRAAADYADQLVPTGGEAGTGVALGSSKSSAPRGCSAHLATSVPVALDERPRQAPPLARRFAADYAEPTLFVAQSNLGLGQYWGNLRPRAAPSAPCPILRPYGFRSPFL